MIDGVSYEAIGATVAILTALFAVYNSGLQRGKIDGKITSMEKAIAAIEGRNDKANEELNSRITRLDERIDARLQSIQTEIVSALRIQSR